MKEDPERLSRGIDFLDIKNGLLAEYNTNLAYLVMKKTRGELIEGDKVVERLCYLSTMLEKIRPIEHKLKFQIDKYVNLAETGQVRPDDPTRFKANPGMLSSKLGEGEDEGEGVKKAGQKKPQTFSSEPHHTSYQPPQLYSEPSSVHQQGQKALFHPQWLYSGEPLPFCHCHQQQWQPCHTSE